MLIPHLVVSRGLTPAALGAALALMAATSIGALAAAGPLADRVGRRPVAFTGAAGFAIAFVLLATVETPAALWPTVALYGVASGFLDLAANAVGADYERAYRVLAMVRLHAGFSASAAAGALLAGAVGPCDVLDRGGVLRSARGRGRGRAAASARAHRARRDRWPPRLLRIPAIALAVALCTLCFFGDGAIEGYAALFLRDVLASGALLTGAALAAFHSASVAGRLLLPRIGDERRMLIAAGLLASAAMAVVVAAGSAAVAAVALLVVGFALSPIVPTALSLAGRSAPGRSATAVSLVTTIGYGAFVAGPPLVGALAGLTSLRTALVPVVISTAAIALLARRLPRPR